MKLIVKIVFLSLLTLPAIAQKSIHQIGMSASLHKPFSEGYTYSYYLTNLPKTLSYRIQYKIQINSFQLRSSVGYSQQKINNKMGGENSSFSSLVIGNINSYEGSLGIEKKFGSKKLKPYVASDVFFSLNKGLIDYANNGCFGSEDGTRNVNTQTYGIRAIGGLSYQFNKSISCHLELSLGIAQERSREISNYGYSYNTFGINPVQNLGIMYTFN